MIWLSYAVLTLAAVTLLIWPVIRNAKTTAQETEADQSVYRAQLDEVERDLSHGILTDAEAETARVEIKRRLLAASRRSGPSDDKNAPAIRMFAVTAIAVTVPFGALAIYLSIGTPGLPAAGSEDRRAEALANPDMADFDILIEDLADRLRQDPDSSEGWVLLARSYRQVNRLEESASAYRRALAIGATNVETYTEFADTLTALNNGTVTPEAADIFRAVLRTNRDEPRSRFYLGLAEAQAGNVANAIAIWRDLTADAPADAPWLAMVRDQMGQVAMASNIMPMTVTPRHPLDGEAVPSPAIAAPLQQGVIPEADEEDFRPDVSALAGRFSGDELVMIQEMVGGLEARLEFGPEDYDGWMQLGRSYGVLGDTEKSANAYRQATQLRQQAIEPRILLADLLLKTVSPSASIPDEVSALSEEILKLDDNNPDGLFIAGLSAASVGDITGARTHWTRLLDILPAGDSARTAVLRRLEELPD